MSLVLVKAAIVSQLERLARLTLADLLAARYDRFRRIGVIVEPLGEPVPVKRPWWKKVLGR